MSRPRFLADHDLNEHVIDGALRREPALEFIRARDVGMADRPDPEVLEYAAAEGLIVVSHDVNTMPAHAYARLAGGQPLAGLLMVKQTHPIGPIIDSPRLDLVGQRGRGVARPGCFPAAVG
jgi:predicted nuclease of predicted toxin-antitoxin system